MTVTNPIGMTTPISGQTSAPDKSALGKDEFLRMLVAQLQHQDPLSPMESTEFTAQLAQFSSLEQLTNVNDNLKYLQLYQASLNNAQAVNFIGKTVKASGDSISVTGGVAGKIQFNLAGNAGEANVYVYDSAGNPVKTIECGALSAGGQSIEWDGTNDDGYGVSDGKYSFDVVATDADGNTVDASRMIEAKVTGVTFDAGTTYLLSGDVRIAMGDVIEVTEGTDK
jgi:flagellar basal-body rod modification protein FlgD